MDVLIRTLPLHNANYGGILQNWALQHSLKELGASPLTDISTRPLTPSKESLKAVLRSVRNILLPSSLTLTAGEKKRASSAKILSFVDREISTTALFRPWASTPSTKVLGHVDAFITGSDQVWRAKYGDVGSYLFDFLPSQDKRPRVAYAGSFGSDPDQVVEQLSLQSLQDHLTLFTAVSCREESGTAWINEHGIGAVTMPDPTILPPLSAYEELISRAPERVQTPTNPYLFAYILDQEPALVATLEELAASKGLSLVVAGSSVVDENGLRIGVEQWIAMFRDAAAVITDSFHGMVFSSRFGTPFAAVPNHARGLERFTSFSESYGLEDRLVTSVSAAASVLMDPLPRELPQRFAHASLIGRKFLSHALGISHVDNQ